MERVYKNSVRHPNGTAFLCALPISYLLFCAGVLPTGPNNHISTTSFLVTLGVLFLALRAALTWYIRRIGSCEGLGNRSKLAERMRGRSWEAVATRYAQARGAGDGTRPPSSGGAIWLKIGVGVAVAVVGFYVYEAEFSQYASGRKAGIRHVREVSQKGPFIRARMNAAKMIDLIPNNPNASPDWNAGFRAGFREELERMHPETKGR